MRTTPGPRPRASKPQRLRSTHWSFRHPHLVCLDLGLRRQDAPARPLCPVTSSSSRKTAVVHSGPFSRSAGPRLGRFREKARGDIRPHPFVVCQPFYPGAWPPRAARTARKEGASSPSGSGGRRWARSRARGRKVVRPLGSGRERRASAPERRWGEGREERRGPLHEFPSGRPASLRSAQ